MLKFELAPCNDALPDKRKKEIRVIDEIPEVKGAYRRSR